MNDAHLIRWVVPATHPMFEGHFPGNPVLPAVAILDEALARLGEAGGIAALEAIEGAKFTKPVTPGLVLAISLARSDEKRWLVTFREEGGDGKNIAELSLRLR